MKKITRSIALLFSLSLLVACTPKVGSPEWCKMMKKKDKGDWTVNESKDFLKHCAFKMGD